MNILRQIMLFLMIFIYSNLICQENASIKGLVIDDNNNPIENMDVILTKCEKPTVACVGTIKETSTDDNGQFSFENLDYVDYEVSIKVSPDSVYLSPELEYFKLSGPNPTMATFILEKDPNKIETGKPSEHTDETSQTPKNSSIIGSIFLEDKNKSKPVIGDNLPQVKVVLSQKVADQPEEQELAKSYIFIFNRKGNYKYQFNNIEPGDYVLTLENLPEIYELPAPSEITVPENKIIIEDIKLTLVPAKTTSIDPIMTSQAQVGNASISGTANILEVYDNKLIRTQINKVPLKDMKAKVSWKSGKNFDETDVVNGTYIFNKLNIGSYTLEIDGFADYLNVSDDTKELTVKIKNDNDNLTDKNFDLEGTGKISGSISTDDQSSVSGLNITLNLKKPNADKISQSVLARDDGTYEFNDLLPGNYTITIIPPSGYKIDKTKQSLSSKIDFTKNFDVENKNFIITKITDFSAGISISEDDLTQRIAEIGGPIGGVLSVVITYAIKYYRDRKSLRSDIEKTQNEKNSIDQQIKDYEKNMKDYPEKAAEFAGKITDLKRESRDLSNKIDSLKQKAGDFIKEGLDAISEKTGITKDALKDIFNANSAIDVIKSSIKAIGGSDEQIRQITQNPQIQSLTRQLESGIDPKQLISKPLETIQSAIKNIDFAKPLDPLKATQLKSLGFNDVQIGHLQEIPKIQNQLKSINDLIAKAKESSGKINANELQREIEPKIRELQSTIKDNPFLKEITPQISEFTSKLTELNKPGATIETIKPFETSLINLHPSELIKPEIIKTMLPELRLPAISLESAPISGKIGFGSAEVHVSVPPVHGEVV